MHKNLYKKISAIRIGKKAKALFCDNYGCTGDWDEMFEVRGPWMTNRLRSHNDEIKEIRVSEYDEVRFPLV